MKNSYKKSGVDLTFANAIIPRIKQLVRRTRRPEVLADIGPFGSLFQLQQYHSPVLVASADGVGTKISMALQLRRLESIGIDLVAMNVNDVLAMGAEPLFFLDYIGLGRDQRKFLPALISGMTVGCRTAGCALIGGETAEMPRVYGGKRLGLSGTAVGVVERKKIIDGKAIRPGDVILGLASSGPHANGFSLINALFRPSSRLLVPTRIYVKSVLSILRRYPIHGLAHITGGGLYDNIARILPSNTSARLEAAKIPTPGIFYDIQKRARISDREMFHAFNMGIGFVVILPEGAKHAVIKELEKEEKVYEIGIITRGPRKVIIK